MPITLPAEALIEFNRLCPIDVCPTLTSNSPSAEVEEILAKFKRAVLWSGTTTFQLGAVVIPTLPNRNGHRFQLKEYTTTGSNQQSGTTEPAWSTTRDSQITDGSLIWHEAGYDWDGVLWDFQAAAREGWLLKASKSVTAADTQAEQLSIKSSQLFDHCMKMAAMYQPAYVL